MAQFDESQSPYNNGFDITKRYSQVLFRPDRPALAQELLEQTSMIYNQHKLLGDTLFQKEMQMQNGAIVSGMSISPIPVAEQADTSTNLPNSFSVSSLDAECAAIDTTDYVNDGNLTVTTKATLATDQPAVQLTGTATSGMYLVLDFFVRKVSGKLTKVGIQYDKTILDPTSYLIDSATIATAPDDMTDSPIVIQGGTQVNLDDGTLHHFQVVFKTLKSGQPQFTLNINPNSDSLNNPVSLVLNKPYLHEGQDTKMTWVINPNDKSLASSTLRNQQYHVSSGYMWLDGAVRVFNGGDISIKGVGDETIGVELDENVVTAQTDPSLLDQAAGTSTHGMAGADRLQYTLNLTYNAGTTAAPGSVPFITFRDNKINQKAIKPDFASIKAILAKRTYDINGSFRVGGFDGHTGLNPLDSSKIRLNLDAGNAYVRGYNITTTQSTYIDLDKSYTTAKVTDEQVVFHNDTKTASIVNQPIQSVDNVSVQMQATNPTVTRNASSDTDVFTTENAYQIIQVKQNSTVYVEGQDFSRSSDNAIRWGYAADGSKLLNAQVPSGGSSYSVIYRYAKNLTKGTDYQVKVEPDKAITYLDFSQAKQTPIDGSNISISYTYFQARIDMIMITQNQENPFAVVKGTPDALGKVKPPVIKDNDSLELGYVLIYPNSDKAEFVMDTVTNIPFSGIQDFNRRLDNLEYNAAIQDMYNNVHQHEDPVTALDTFSDSFTTLEKADTSYATSDPKTSWGVAFNLDDGSATLATEAESISAPDIDSSNSDYNLRGDLLVAPYTDSLVVKQEDYTGVKNVNPYHVFNVQGNLSISPDSDTWTDTKSNMVQTSNGDVKHVDVNLFWRHMSNIEDLRTHFNNDTMQYFGQIQGIDWSDPSLHTGDTRTGYILSSQGSTTTDTLIEFMRQRQVSFTATNFLAYEDGFNITIDGTPAQDITPASDIYKGTTGALKADGDGNIKGSFIIPGGTIRCGTRPVRIYNAKGSQATTTYTAVGTMETTTSIINKQEVVASIVDPLAQSFNVSQDCYLSRLKLYFQSKETNAPTEHTSNVEIQIRALTDGGNPSKVMLAKAVLTPDEVNVSSDASVATDVLFDNMIQLRADTGYCVVIISDSENYNMFVAEAGKAKLNGDHSVIGGAPNPNGVLFTSNNAQTWVADPNTSLKFEVYRAIFNTTGEVQFEPIDLTTQPLTDVDTGKELEITAKQIDKLALATVMLTPQNTGCSWEYRLFPLNGTAWGQWTPITPINNNEATVSPTENQSDRMKMWQELLSESSKLQLRATFKSSQGVSPIVSKPNISFKGLLTKTSGSYVGITAPQPGDAQFNSYRVQFDADIPEGCKVTPYVSIDNGTSWLPVSKDGKSDPVPDTVENVGIKYKRYIYNGVVPTATDKYHLASSFKVRLQLEAPNNFVSPTVKKLVCLMRNTLNKGSF